MLAAATDKWMTYSKCSFETLIRRENRKQKLILSVVWGEKGQYNNRNISEEK